MHQIAILALDGVIPIDLAIPCDVFSHVRLPGDEAGYHVRVCGEAGELDAGAFGLHTRWGLDDMHGAHTIVVPGIRDVSRPVPPKVLQALRQAAHSGTRIASICSGAFVLAATGLLDGLRATTHWAAAAELAQRHPQITVDPQVLFIDNGQILTSAGAAAGLDLCLHMVRRDHGATVAADVARLSVMPLARDGGQAQFIAHPPPASSQGLQALLQWLEAHAEEPLTLEDIARQAATSTRTLNRRFQEQVGTTPLQWLLNARVRRAQRLLESTAMTVEQVATESGFASAAALRERFARQVGNSPQGYRRAFGPSLAAG